MGPEGLVDRAEAKAPSTAIHPSLLRRKSAEAVALLSGDHRRQYSSCSRATWLSWVCRSKWRCCTPSRWRP